MNIHLSFAPKLLDKNAAAYYLSTSTRKLDELQALGKVTPRALGNKRVYLRDELDDFASSLGEWKATA